MDQLQRRSVPMPPGMGGGIAVLPNLLFLVPVVGGNYFRLHSSLPLTT